MACHISVGQRLIVYSVMSVCNQFL